MSFSAGSLAIETVPQNAADLIAIGRAVGNGTIKLWNVADGNVIREFANLTGVPVVLNTSFNDNEPIVCRPEEAIECFLRTKMDVLVLGDILVRKPTSAEVPR